MTWTQIAEHHLKCIVENTEKNKNNSLKLLFNTISFYLYVSAASMVSFPKLDERK